ncbi:MAG: thioesterase [Candidatus Cloacimonetes bacterium HGW-Cloacimonetes-3]|jgi:YbgC/YbaW family acyl-CoA thioester hydrolase|nr:MAG: thioesterase [Candidatus Cloacimonetes bacterium HGW-Cloacimonetes-3]
MIFTYQKRIYGFECDIYGHLNNANYLQLLEAARSEALIDMKLPIMELKERGVQLFVYRFELDYLKSVDLDEVAVVKSSYSEINRIKGKWLQEVFNSKGEKCLNAVLTVVFAAEGKAARLPVDVFEKFKLYMEPPV